MILKAQFDELKKNTENIKSVLLELEKIKFEIEKLKSISTPQKIESRIEDLELWRSKVHALMIEKTPSNKEKLSPFAKTLQMRGFP